MNVLIVDDDSSARERLRRLLRTMIDRERPIHQVSNGTAAIGAILEHGREWMFLDVEMPGCDGFSVLKELAELAPPVSLLVSGAGREVTALEAAGFPCVNKRAGDGEYRHQVSRALERMSAWPESVPPVIASILAGIEEQAAAAIPVASADGVGFLAMERVDWIEEVNLDVHLHTGRAVYSALERLSGLEARLPRQFLRVSSSAIVNTRRIQTIGRAKKRGKGRPILMQDEATIVAGRSYGGRVTAVARRWWQSHPELHPLTEATAAASDRHPLSSQWTRSRTRSVEEVPHLETP